MKEFLKSIGIEKPGYFGKSGSYVIDLADSNEMSRYLTILDKSDEVDEMTDRSTLTLLGVNAVYANDEYEITLIGDYQADVYKIVVDEI